MTPYQEMNMIEREVRAAGMETRWQAHSIPQEPLSIWARIRRWFVETW